MQISFAPFFALATFAKVQKQGKTLLGVFASSFARQPEGKIALNPADLPFSQMMWKNKLTKKRLQQILRVFFCVAPLFLFVVASNFFCSERLRKKKGM